MRKILAMLIIFFMLFSTGCWDKDELEDWGYVAVVGLDKGKDDQINVTLELTNPQVGTSLNSSVQEPSKEAITLPGFNIITIKDLANTTITRRLTLTHAVALVVSEEFAKSDDFFRVIESFMRNKDIRGDLNIIVCREKASTFIKETRPPFETRPTKFYYFMANRWKDTGLVPLSSLHRFITRTQMDTSLFLSIYGTSRQGRKKQMAAQESNYIAGEVDKESDSPTEMLGSTVFKKGKMVGKLSGDQTQIALLLRTKHDVRSISANLTDPLNSKYKVSIKAFPKGNTKVKMDLSGDTPKIDVKVQILAQIVGIPSCINYVTDIEKQEVLQNAIQTFFEEESSKLIKMTQKDFGGEPFLWGQRAQKYFSTTKDFKKYNFMQKYPNANINVSFDVKIKNFGRLLSPPDIDKISSGNENTK